MLVVLIGTTLDLFVTTSFFFSVKGPRYLTARQFTLLGGDSLEFLLDDTPL